MKNILINVVHHPKDTSKETLWSYLFGGVVIIGLIILIVCISPLLFVYSVAIPSEILSNNSFLSSHKIVFLKASLKNFSVEIVEVVVILLFLCQI